MDRAAVLQKTQEYVHNKLTNQGAGHDWWHIYRVQKLALYLAKKEGADSWIVQLGALLHDIADWKFHEEEEAGPQVARSWLETWSVPESSIDHVCEIVRDISFKGAGVPTPMATLEGKVVQDADRLDALGAIGIARTFEYGGYKGQPTYDPHLSPQFHKTFEQYKTKRSTSINHFYEKLLRLKDLMNTPSAQAIAQQRHTFMEQFLEQFFLEWTAYDDEAP